MRSIVACLALIVSISCVAAEDKKENPYKTAKVGDYVVYKTTSKGQKDGSMMKQQVTAVSDKEVTLEITTNVLGKDYKTTQKIDLTKEFDAVPKDIKSNTKELESGKETLEIGGKKYDCEWKKSKTTVNVQGKDFTTESKVWTSKSVPFGGLVKAESVSDVGGSITELVEFKKN